MPFDRCEASQNCHRAMSARRFGVVRPEGALLLGREVLHDGAALPEHEVAVDERRDLAVRVERQVVGLLEVAHRLLGDLDVQTEVLDHRVDAPAVVRVVDAVELHGPAVGHNSDGGERVRPRGGRALLRDTALLRRLRREADRRDARRQVEEDELDRVLVRRKSGRRVAAGRHGLARCSSRWADPDTCMSL